MPAPRPRKGLEEVDDAAWQADIELKLMAAVRLCRRGDPARCGRAAAARSSTRRSSAARRRRRAALPTSVTRAAGINLTKSLANEYAAANIRVNTICIGLIKSAQWQRRAGNRPVDELYAEMGRRVPLGRMGEAEEYADLVAFLVSARARLHHRHRDQPRRRHGRHGLAGAALRRRDRLCRPRQEPPSKAMPKRHARADARRHCAVGDRRPRPPAPRSVPARRAGR